MHELILAIVGKHAFRQEIFEVLSVLFEESVFFLLDNLRAVVLVGGFFCFFWVVFVFGGNEA